MTEPTGQVTFLFTDIEGSTKLAQSYPEIIQSALDRHQNIIQETFEAAGGFIFEIVGDSFCCAFQNAEDAIRAAVHAQSALCNEPWNDAVIKVRMGIYSGPAEWSGSRYMGYITLARTARIMAAAYGGQILISGATFEAVKHKFASTVQKINFKNLGERRLRDLIEPVTLYQVIAPGLCEEFPALKTLDARPNNLPLQLTSFIGRNEDLTQIKNFLRQNRMLTLTGPGGTGKTRLALQAGADVIDDFEHGVWFAELATVNDPSFLPLSILKSLDIPEQPNQNATDTLIENLKDKNLLLILDNCEHIVEACTHLSEKLLRNSTQLKILTTSREALQCSGEQVFRTLPLATPTSEIVSPEQITQYESVRLFIERALAIHQQFRITESNCNAVAGICYQLDGIPLAIELAAARTKILTPEKIFERLDDKFRLLTGGQRTALPKQQTLKAMIDWSYDLLSDNEKLLWNRLSIFTGGWTMETAEEICSDEKLTKDNIMDTLSSLTEKSIVMFNSETERFNILQTLKQYGEGNLKRSDEFDILSERHLKFYLDFAKEKNEKIRGSDAETQMKMLEYETGNIGTALKYSLENGLALKTIELASLMSKFWQYAGYLSEGIHWLNEILCKESLPKDSVYARLICQLGNFYRLRGDVDKAQSLIEESLEIRRTLDDEAGIADSLIRMGLINYDQSKFDEAIVFYEEALQFYERSANEFSVAIVINNMGNIYSLKGEYARAYELYEQSLAIRRRTGDKHGAAITLNNLGIIAFDRGEYDKADELLNESLVLRKQVANKEGIAITYMNLGNVSYCRGDYENARNYYDKSLMISKEIGNKGCEADSMYNLAKTETELDSETALQLLNKCLELSSALKAKSQVAQVLYSFGKISFRKNDLEQAKKYYHDSIMLDNESGNRKDISLTLLRLAEIHFTYGKYINAAMLFGFIDMNYFRKNKIKFPKCEEVVYNEILDSLKKEMDEEGFQNSFEKGGMMSPEETIEMAVKF